MTRLARILVVALIGMLAAWSIAQAASATTMSLEMGAMRAADSRAMDMAGCTGCDVHETSNKAAPHCHLVCVAPILADLTTSPMLILGVLIALYVAGPLTPLVGRTHSPDPHPPRSVLLV